MHIVQKNEIEKKQLFNEIIKTFKKGGLVVLPTDTVYGFAVDATSKQAVGKLIACKSRLPGNPISIFVGTIAIAAKYVVIDVKTDEVLCTLLPGPYTVILSSRHLSQAELESEKGTLGIRIPKDGFINGLVQEFKRPITATSANRSGRPPHYSVASFLKSLSKNTSHLIDLIVDGGELPRNLPSTVLDLTKETIEVLRYGDIIPSSKSQKSQTHRSVSTTRTRKIAQDVIHEHVSIIAKKPLVIILEGELGAGKTQFVKGIGEYLGIKDVVSPTYVVYYEYITSKKPITKLHHFDLYAVQDESEFEHLGIEESLKPGNVVCIEWGEKSGAIYEMLKKKAEIVYVKMEHVDEETRDIQIIINDQHPMINE